MTTITNTISIAVITIAIIAIITIAIFIISPRPNTHTFAHNLWETGSRFRWKIWVGDLFSPRSNCVPFLQNPRLQLSTPWPWGIVRSGPSGSAEAKVQTMISTDARISATICCPPPLPTACHLPPCSRCSVHATQHVSEISRRGVWYSRQLAASLGAGSEVYLGKYSEVFLGEYLYCIRGPLESLLGSI